MEKKIIKEKKDKKSGKIFDKIFELENQMLALSKEMAKNMLLVKNIASVNNEEFKVKGHICKFNSSIFLGKSEKTIERLKKSYDKESKRLISNHSNKKSEWEKNMDELSSNPHVKKAMKQIGKNKGRIGKIMTKIRYGDMSKKEIIKFLDGEQKKIKEAKK